MNNKYTIDLSLIPTTLDLWHVYLLIAVLVLALILIIVLLAIMVKGTGKSKQLNNESAKPTVAPEIKVVEKIIEVEKIVQAPTPKPVVLKEATADAALQLLGLLQKEARFIDFIKEDISAYADADIGIAARVVHEGCNNVMNEYFSLNTLRTEQEGSKITLEKGFNAAEVRLTGNIVGEAPFTGTLIHKGWQVSEVRLPKLTQSHNANIVAAAEVEL